MPLSPTDPASLSAAIKDAAAQAGFGLCGITSATTPDSLQHFHDWIDAGYAGEMRYIERRKEAYADSEKVLAGTRSIVVVAVDYRTEEPLTRLAGHGRISRYAWGETDYHDLIRARLTSVADVLHSRVPGVRTRAVVDSAPVLERDAARRAGLGWFGKNTMLISKHRGSFLFLGALLTDCELAADSPHETSHCGTCTACLDACPTDAFAQPYVLDARKCISYLTIELREEPIPPPLDRQLDGWLFGCDICQEVCPWNSKSHRSPESGFEPLPVQMNHAPDTPKPPSSVGQVNLESLLAMDEAAFQERFGGTPLERTGLTTLQRTAKAILGAERLPDSPG